MEKYKVKDLVKELMRFDQDAVIMVSSDEELNMIHYGYELARLDDKIENNRQVVVLYPLSYTADLDY